LREAAEGFGDDDEGLVMFDDEDVVDIE